MRAGALRARRGARQGGRARVVHVPWRLCRRGRPSRFPLPLDACATAVRARARARVSLCKRQDQFFFCGGFLSRASSSAADGTLSLSLARADNSRAGLLKKGGAPARSRFFCRSSSRGAGGAASCRGAGSRKRRRARADATSKKKVSAPPPQKPSFPHASFPATPLKAARAPVLVDSWTSFVVGFCRRVLRGRRGVVARGPPKKKKDRGFRVGVEPRGEGVLLEEIEER